MKDYPLHPGQTSMPPQFVQLPLENYEAISKELAELRTHEVEWDLAKARINELESEKALLKRDVETLTEILKRHKLDGRITLYKNKGRMKNFTGTQKESNR